MLRFRIAETWNATSFLITIKFNKKTYCSFEQGDISKAFDCLNSVILLNIIMTREIGHHTHRAVCTEHGYIQSTSSEHDKSTPLEHGNGSNNHRNRHSGHETSRGRSTRRVCGGTGRCRNR